MKLIYMECTINLMQQNGTTVEQINELALNGTVKTLDGVPYLVICD